MTDIFGFLETNQWLAILRIAIGLWWIKSVLHKPRPGFVQGGMVKWTVALAENHPIPAFGNAIRKLVEPNRVWFPWMVLLGEAVVGLGLVFGDEVRGEVIVEPLFVFERVVDLGKGH